MAKIISREYEFPGILKRHLCGSFCDFLKKEIGIKVTHRPASMERKPMASLLRNYVEGRVNADIFFIGDYYFTKMKVVSEALSEEKKYLIRRLHSDIANNYRKYFE